MEMGKDSVSIILCKTLLTPTKQNKGKRTRINNGWTFDPPKEARDEGEIKEMMVENEEGGIEVDMEDINNKCVEKARSLLNKNDEMPKSQTLKQPIIDALDIHLGG